MTPEQAAQLIDMIDDYAICSDLRAYAWGRRRWLQETGASSDMIKYAREVEQSKAQHAQDAFDGVREFVEALVRGESPALRADRDDAREVLSEFVSSADAAVKAQLSKSSTSHEVLNTRSAAGIVVECWRDVLEPWHYYFSDAEMAWMSMITTRDIAHLIDVRANAIDFEGVRRVMTDGDREVLPETSVRDALGPAWRSIAHRIADRITSAVANGMTAATYVGWAGRVCSDWWGGTRWVALAEQVAEKLELDDVEAQQLVHAPHRLPFERWEAVIEALANIR